MMIKVVMTHVEVELACEEWLAAHGMMVGNGAAQAVKLKVHREGHIPLDDGYQVDAVVEVEAEHFSGPYR